MCVSGMLPPRPDHARAALRLALELHAAAGSVCVVDSDSPVHRQQRDAAGSGLSIRVGVHSGPVTSGVIGHTRARFCVFGAPSFAPSFAKAHRAKP
jgi:class 3 adenylate cyclase